jgi:hypothetical protein
LLFQEASSLIAFPWVGPEMEASHQVPQGVSLHALNLFSTIEFPYATFSRRDIAGRVSCPQMTE